MTIIELSNYLDIKGCNLIGCSTQEILKIESFFKIKLPFVYREFLYSMGKEAGIFMKGSSVFYSEIFDLKEGSSRLLEEDEFQPLPLDTYVFWMHQGYQFAFFYLNGSDDPPIYFYYEGQKKREFEQKENSFSTFLEKQLLFSGI